MHILELNVTKTNISPKKKIIINKIKHLQLKSENILSKYVP